MFKQRPFRFGLMAHGAESRKEWMATAREAEDLSGSYAVQGLTVQALSGRQREIHGSFELRVNEGGRYEVAFELDTTAPDLPGDVPVQVRGSGRGFAVAGTFTGTTEEWMTLEPPAGGLAAADLSVPLPAAAGHKLVSISQASFDEDGVLHVLLQNRPKDSESYEPSMTVLAGRRVGDLPARPGGD